MKQDDTKIFKGDYYKWPEDDFTKEMPGIAFASGDVIAHLKVFFKSLEKVDDEVKLFSNLTDETKFDNPEDCSVLLHSKKEGLKYGKYIVQFIKVRLIFVLLWMNLFGILKNSILILIL